MSKISLPLRPRQIRNPYSRFYTLHQRPSTHIRMNPHSPRPSQSYTTTTPLSKEDPDPSLHPNPKVQPRTDPSSAGAPTEQPPSAEELREKKTGHASSEAQASLDGKGPNTEQLPHVSEEAAAMSKVTGEGGVDLDSGTPVGEVSFPGDDIRYVTTRRV